MATAHPIRKGEIFALETISTPTFLPGAKRGEGKFDIYVDFALREAAAATRDGKLTKVFAPGSNRAAPIQIGSGTGTRALSISAEHQASARALYNADPLRHWDSGADMAAAIRGAEVAHANPHRRVMKGPHVTRGKYHGDALRLLDRIQPAAIAYHDRRVGKVQSGTGRAIARDFIAGGTGEALREYGDPDAWNAGRAWRRQAMRKGSVATIARRNPITPRAPAIKAGEEILLYGIPKGERERYAESILTTKCKDQADVDKVCAAASKDGWHSFRAVKFSPGERPNFGANVLRRNPRGARARAIALYSQFHGHKPPPGDIVRIGMRKPADALAVGELDGIMYRVRGEAKSFLHRFTKTRRPLLFVSSDGSQIFVLKGAFRFTDRGFVR